MVFQLCACHPHTSNITVAERFATFRYYCLMRAHARGGLTVTIHENTPISRIVYETRIYYPLLCGGIFSCYWIARKPVLALTLALRRYKDSALIYFSARDCLIRKAVHRIAD